MSPTDPADRDGPDRSNPWTTLSTRLIYDNPWISLREDRVVRPDGQEGIYGVVHFKGRAVGVLPVDEAGRVWLVGQYRYPLDVYSWEIPEGGSPESETPEETARRELREETGLLAGRLELIATSHLSNSVSDEVAYIFRATELTEGPVDPEGCERIEVRRVEWEEAWSMLRRGEITDSMSVIALLNEAVRRLEGRGARGEGIRKEDRAGDEEGTG
jgi:8-oxo-dGTP pyrophosphatase MutT (NUDIX family)